ncbi:hypothetical protein [Serratia sp. JUb9]
MHDRPWQNVGIAPDALPDRR